MSDDDQKNPDKVAEQLRKEFIKGETDREVAMTQLSERRMNDGESPAQFAHEVRRLAKLAYPGFNAEALMTVTRDSFVRGLLEELRLEIKKDRRHSTEDVSSLTDEVKGLQLAGVGKKPMVQTTRAPCTTPTVDEHTLDQLAELLKEKLETPERGLTARAIRCEEWLEGGA